MRHALHGWLLVWLLAVPPAAASGDDSLPSVDGLLKVGQSVERPLVGGAMHLYAIDAKAGDYVELVVEQRGIDVVVTLASSKDEMLTEVDSPNGRHGEERLRSVIGSSVIGSARPSPLRLTVRSPSPTAQPGDYRLTVETVRPASVEDRVRAVSDAALRDGRRQVQGGGEGLQLAVASLVKAGDGYRRLGEMAHEAAAHFHLSVAMRRLGRYEEALEQAQAAASLYGGASPEGGTPVEQARLFNGMALIHRQLGQLDPAAVAYRRALELWRRANSVPGAAMTLHNLAFLEERLGHTAVAEDLYGQALELWAELGNPVQRGVTLGYLGRLHRNRGHLHLAIDLQNQALVVLRRAERPDLVAAGLNNLATYYASLGDFESSLSLLYEALQIRRSELKIDREIAQTLNNLSWTYLMLGGPRRALPLSQEAIALTEGTDDQADRARFLDTLGRIHLALEDPVAAKAALAAALELHLELADEVGQVKILEATGRAALLSGELAEAEGLLRQSLLGAQRLGERVAEASARDGLSALYRQRGESRRALQEIEAAIGIIESLRQDAISGDLQASFLARKRLVYETQIDILQTLHGEEPEGEWAAAALAASERAKARSLLDSLAAVGGGEPPVLASPSISQPLAVASIRHRVLDPETLLLEIGLGDARSFLWLLDGESVESFELPSRAILEAAVRPLVESLAQPPSARPEDRLRADALARQLAGWLLEPFADRLRDRRLLWIAEGALLELPLAILPDPRSVDGEPLLVRNEVVSAPSASVLAGLRRHGGRQSVAPPPASRTLAILADPVFREVAQLPASKLEAAALASLLPTEETLLALGVAASKGLVLGGRLAGYRFVHFATHGVLDTRSPELSALVLSQQDADGQPVDGFLRLQDIYGLELAADLVVLSACQTALGKPVRGEGVWGLVRGFMVSGVPRVVASLWRVDDRATAALMERFYRGMLEDHLPAAAALRRAQLAMLRGEAGRGWRAPYYWAGFQLQGEWR